MSDIVERLRDASYAQAPSRCMEAAKEIERLRSIVRVNALRWGHTHAEIDTLLTKSPAVAKSEA